ncbi:MAG: ABC transporter substrate-binding protein [Clostridiales bacterium]|nr:ABC transporter substrate-binding protein [Clostridiales bacterium]
MKLKKMLALGMACALTVSMAVPASAEVKGTNEDEANTVESDETLRIALASEPSSIWGAGAANLENEGLIISNALFDTLVVKDYNTGEILPNVATEWEWVDDTHCTFTLRDDVVLTNGEVLTADDVVYCVEELWMALNPSNEVGMYFEGAVADDEFTVTIEFSTVAPDLVEMLSWADFGLVSQAEIEALGGPEAAAKNPLMGSGKYQFVEWENGQSITLTRNEDYWNEDYVGYFKDIVFTFTSDAAAREMAVESGDIDVAYAMPITQAAAYAASDAVQTVIYNFGQNMHLWYNMTDEHATSELLVRQAIDLALDFDALNMVGTAGYGEDALGYFTTDSPYYTQLYTAEERAVDIDGAKALLEEAGYGDGLELTAVGMQDLTAAYTVIQENLREVGITLTINTVDTAQFVEDAFGGNYDLILVGEYTAGRYPTLFVFMQEEQVEGGTIVGGPKVTTDEIDGLITEIIEASDEETAKEKADELQNILKDDMIVSNLYSEMQASVISNDLKGYGSIERGYIDATTLYK